MARRGADFVKLRIICRKCTMIKYSFAKMCANFIQHNATIKENSIYIQQITKFRLYLPNFYIVQHKNNPQFEYFLCYLAFF